MCAGVTSITPARIWYSSINNGTGSEKMSYQSDNREYAGIVGRNVRAERKALRWNQTQLAQALTDNGWTLTQSRVSALERNGTFNGRKRQYVVITVDRLALLAEVLGVDVKVLLEQ